MSLYSSENFVISNYDVIYSYNVHENKDAFISIKPHNSWILNETTCCWEAPVPYPSTFTLNLKKPDNTPREDIYEWDENNINWKLLQL